MSTQSDQIIGVVSTPHYMATRAGARVLQQGGNAFDAAVAVSLAIGVTQPYNSGIGGGCSITYRTADGRQGMIDARGPAPRQLQRERYLGPDGTPDYERATMGGMASVLPSMLAGLQALHSERGHLSWADVCQEPHALARDGFVVDFKFANVYQEPHSQMKLARHAQNTLFATPIHEGDWFVQPQLADTLAILGEDPRSFYEGDIAQQLVDHVQQIGGVWELADLAGYRPREGALYECTYRGWRILAPGLPTIGALQVLLILQILEHFELSTLVPGSADHLHLVIEACKAAYGVRASLSSDAEAAQIADAQRARQLAGMIRRDRALPFEQMLSPGDLGSCTSHFCVADAAGNVVSQTQTVRSFFGSGVVEPRTGILLNDSVGDFSLQAGEATTQGIQYRGTYNLAAPGAQPASSQSPIIAWHPEKEEMIAVGAAGGPKIVSATVQALLNCIDFGMDARRSAAAPRVHCHGPIAEVEPGITVIEELAQRGHEIEQVRYNATLQMIRRGPAGWEGGADPRGPGAAAEVVRATNGSAARVYGSWYT